MVYSKPQCTIGPCLSLQVLWGRGLAIALTAALTKSPTWVSLWPFATSVAGIWIGLECAKLIYLKWLAPAILSEILFLQVFIRIVIPLNSNINFPEPSIYDGQLPTAYTTLFSPCFILPGVNHYPIYMILIFIISSEDSLTPQCNNTLPFPFPDVLTL